MTTRALLATLLSVLALSAASAEARAATVGPHGPAGVTCYSDGTITIAPNFDKIGYGAQTLGYRTWLRDRRTGAWYVTAWRTFNLPYGALFNVGKDWLRMRPSDYDVVLDYAWNLGAGWGTDTTWTPSYTIGGDFFGHDESTCWAMPRNVTVSGCADFGGVVSCPRAPHGRRRTAGARRTRVVRTKRHVARAPHITLR